MQGKALLEQDYIDAARLLQCEVAVIKAVTKKEAPRGGFLPDGQPVILFERHIFRRMTGGKYDKSHPHLSAAQPGGYGSSGMNQHKRLSEAVALNREAALQSASWGRFQIMGFNWRASGYASLGAFITAMYRNEGAHLQAFSGFVASNPAMLAALKAKDWAEFARRYNGPDYRKNNYDVSLREFYAAMPDGDKRVPSKIAGAAA